MKFDTHGSRSEGLSTNVFPVAIAIGCIHIGTMIGKLNGVIPAHTPSGCRNECRSTSVETWSENSPLVSSAIPHAYSTTSMPRTTSPLASSKVLPCSAEMIRASSSVCCTISSRNANMTRARRTTDTSLQLSNAALAACTAASTSAALAEQHLALLLPGRGIEDGRGARRSAGGRAAADHVVDGLELDGAQ